MRMKICALTILSLVSLGGAEYRGSDDGQVEVSRFTVGGIHAYSVAERNRLQALRPGDPVVTLTPTFFEIALSTTMAKFGNETISAVDDYRKLLTLRPYIADRAKEIEIEIQALEGLSAKYPTINVVTPLARLRAQLNLLFAIWTSL